jgi:hypothetical protein
MEEVLEWRLNVADVIKGVHGCAFAVLEDFALLEFSASMDLELCCALSRGCAAP